MSNHADLEWVFIDDSHIRAHQHATDINHQAISKSIGGNNSKIHLAVDANENPIEFIIGDGTTHDVKVAPRLIDLIGAVEYLVADKGYDSEKIREYAKNHTMIAVIPRKSNSAKSNPEFDAYLYKLRHLVENAFARLKHFRSIATRFDKLARNYKAMLRLACIFIWCKAK